jgi:hypothetical protein
MRETIARLEESALSPIEPSRHREDAAQLNVVA